MANAQKVANIFELASVAFKKLAELTLDLKIFQAQAEQGPSTSSRWTIIEVDQLKDAIARFGNDLTKIASVIETKTLTQIKHKLKSQGLEGPGPERVEGAENDDEKNAGRSPENESGHVQELPEVSTVSVDRGRRKQTFSERNDPDLPDQKKRRLDSGSGPSVLTIPKIKGPVVARHVVPVAGVQRTPITVQTSPAGKPRVVPITPSASNVLSHAHMRKQAVMSQELKYEQYSEDEGDDHFGDDDDDDDDDEESDAPYYSEDETGGNSTPQN
ncbi:Chromatin complexes subunit BAP18 [Echinococcus granulosus]|uniref:MLL1/MLL complex subunit n=1 Tax=Echinococcus granulosus TaxID=6210 RepID=U6JDU5_ECHGR|nr:MLL1/MLL complex subunit [Echinococcus granulosus]EUB61115.1 MLL1/MLL complex subunit [Echinococcus granulosus]KAH9284330.1 Chromatin complexes subunit BAP18 [Echinococcus granulosus]CDS19879.1 SANT DNA binding [Echinococcus granulosus]